MTDHNFVPAHACLRQSGWAVILLTCAGMRDGQQIRFAGEGDQEPGLEPGDIVIVLDEKEHPQFRRRGTDLIMQKEITLVEALCGFHKTIKTLDGRLLVISCLPGEFGEWLGGGGGLYTAVLSIISVLLFGFGFSSFSLWVGWQCAMTQNSCLLDAIVINICWTFGNQTWCGDTSS